MKGELGGENSAGTDPYVVLTTSFLPSSTFLSVRYVERTLYVYWVLINNSSLHSISLSLDYVTHSFSLHHHHQLQNHFPSCYTHFWVSLCLFLVRSLGFLELFSNSPLECLWPPLKQSSLLLGHHENHLIWSELNWAWWPPWASLVLSAFGHLSQGPASHLTILGTIWSEWTLFRRSP